MPIFADPDQDSIFFSMFNQEHLWSRNSPHPIELEGKTWPTVEHYYQAMKFTDEQYQEKIRACTDHKQVLKLGKAWLKKKRSDWKQIETTIMTRALYTKCKIYADISAELLASNAKSLVEDSLYDHFWGCGRDRLGMNNYGKTLMKIRDKLISESN